MSAPYGNDGTGFSGLVEFADENISVTGSAVGFTAATFKNAQRATFFVETAPIRFTEDGTTPTSAVGVLANPGDSFLVWGSENIKGFQAIRTSGVSASIAVQYAK